jgi:hypothetical protein
MMPGPGMTFGPDWIRIQADKERQFQDLERTREQLARKETDASRSLSSSPHSVDGDRPAPSNIFQKGLVSLWQASAEWKVAGSIKYPLLWGVLGGGKCLAEWICSRGFVRQHITYRQVHWVFRWDLPKDTTSKEHGLLLKQGVRPLEGLLSMAWCLQVRSGSGSDVGINVDNVLLE